MTNGSLTNTSILCVDNYIDSLELLKLLLELEGAQVHAAVSTEEAMRIFSAHGPDILISDLALPQGDGISLLRAMRTQDAVMGAIALTGISAPKVRRQALEAGFDHYLVKPVDDHVLIKTVSALASKHRKLSA